MKTRFSYAHARDSDWRMAANLCLAQLNRAGATLGFLYLSDHYAHDVDHIVTWFKEKTGVDHWVGSVALGILASGVEYIDEPAMAVMLADFSLSDFHVFSGVSRPLAAQARTPDGSYAAWSALVHADSRTPDVPELIEDMSFKLASDNLFGGQSSQRRGLALIANQGLSGGIAGVSFSQNIKMAVASTQGYRPLGGVHKITRSKGQLLQTLDGKPALDVLLSDMGESIDAIRTRPFSTDEDRDELTQTTVRMLKGTFLGFGSEDEILHADYSLQPLVGVDSDSRSLALLEDIEHRDHVIFCRLDVHTAKADLIRACAEIREQIDATGRSWSQVKGLIYISCLGRTGNLFGGPSAELKIIEQQLGEVPLVGWFAAGEVCGAKSFAHTGVLVAFY